MPSKPRSRISSLALKTLYGALASAVLLSSAASAAGLGKLTVLSALGQPLRAEIELTSVSPEETSGLVAKVAPADAFKLANIDYSPALLSLRFAVEQRNGRQFIKITSSQALNEPFVDLLLELSWSSGRLVREYTFLLDPPELRATQPAQVAGAPADVPAESARASEAAPAAALAAPAAPRAQPARAPAGRAVPAPSSDSKQYAVKRGDTLGRIAAALKPGDVSLDMMLVALYRANPDAFIGNNMNRLKSGRILAVPDSDALHASGEGDAHGVVVAHAADFNAYRNKLAGQVANAAPAKAQDSGQSASGKIAAKVEERATAANASKDQLKLSKTAVSSGATGKSAVPGTEDTIAKDKAVADAAARLKELERNVSDLEKLIVVKNKAGSEASKRAPAEVSPAENVAPVAVAVPVPVPAPAPVLAAKPAPLKMLAPKAAPEPAERSWLDALMDNLTSIGAGVVVLLLVLFGLSRRKAQDAGAPIAPSILGLPPDQPHDPFAEADGHSVDTSHSDFNTSFAPSASALDTNEVDPVAEADVYIAYGRDAQAEEILKEALRTQPERHAVRHKLLEIYAARKDARAFEIQAGELYGLSRGQGEDWAQAAALGLTLDPLNPLYAPAALPAAVPEPIAPVAQDSLAAAPRLEEVLADPAAPVDAHTLDFDLGGLDFAPRASSAPTLDADPNALDFSAEPIIASALPVEHEQPFDLAFDLAFDLGFDSPVATTPLEPISLEPTSLEPTSFEPTPLDDTPLDLAVAGEHSSVEFDMAELAREFDLPHLAGGAPAATFFTDPLAELDAMDFDLLDLPDAATPARDDDPFALPELPAAASHSAAPPPFDISGIDLDLPFDDSGAHDTNALAAAHAGDVGLSVSYMEMETKLDLAIAYQEIGDKEGARELLDEVVKGGSDEQISKARDLRAKLA